jgi:hypothetical protein
MGPSYTITYFSTTTDSPESWLAGVCFALKGNPGDIIKAIRSLPRAEMLQ